MNEGILLAAAQAAHEVSRVYCELIGDTAVPWDKAPVSQQASAIAGVQAVMDGASPEELHDKWWLHKKAAGWRYGLVKDEAARTHPCMVPYNDLPYAQKVKDELFLETVTYFLDIVK